VNERELPHSKVVRWRSKSFALLFRLVSPSPLMDPKESMKEGKNKSAIAIPAKTRQTRHAAKAIAQGLWPIRG